MYPACTGYTVDQSQVACKYSFLIAGHILLTPQLFLWYHKNTVYIPEDYFSLDCKIQVCICHNYCLPRWVCMSNCHNLCRTCPLVIAVFLRQSSYMSCNHFVSDRGSHLSTGHNFFLLRRVYKSKLLLLRHSYQLFLLLFHMGHSYTPCNQKDLVQLVHKSQFYKCCRYYL